MCAVIIEDFKGLIIFITLRSGVQISLSLQKSSQKCEDFFLKTLQKYKNYVVKKNIVNNNCPR